MKYAHIVETKLQGWYDDSIHSEIPKPNIEVSEQIWQEAISINANCYENKKFIVKDFRTAEEIRKEEINTQIAEAKAYLASTDFYMTVDKYTELDEARKVELTTKRAFARELINTLEAELITLQGAI